MKEVILTDLDGHLFGGAMKTKLEDIKVGDFVNLAADDSNGHDFKFIDLRVTKLEEGKDLFGSPCITLCFGKRKEMFRLPCRYLFEKLPEDIDAT